MFLYEFMQFLYELIHQTQGQYQDRTIRSQAQIMTWRFTGELEDSAEYIVLHCSSGNQQRSNPDVWSKLAMT